jgi:hypothetical protein
MRPNIRKKSVAEALAERAVPRAAATGHKGVRYAVTQDPAGPWRWKVLPANALHVHEYSVAHGFSVTREAAEAAARAAIDAQMDA